MGEPDDEVQSWFDQLSYKLKRELAATIKEEADGLAGAIQRAIVEEDLVLTGELRDSVKVRRKRNELELEVTAGGPATTREITKGSGVEFDYALAPEFGTVHQAAQPYFYSTARRLLPDIQQTIEDKVEDVISRN
ncbi:MAG: hypothetical protein J0H42_04180 [Rhizobiales bacterium]|nr:hypothetical protein [Hyphomicrobiales bacterium]